PRSSKAGTAPTATLPSEREIAAFIERFALKQPDWMPDWQWQRVQELLALGGQSDFPQTIEGYYEWIDHNLAFAPRRWSGFDASEKTQEYALYQDAMPEPVKDHHKLYWESWLMPDVEAKGMAHGYIGGNDFR